MSEDKCEKCKVLEEIKAILSKWRSTLSFSSAKALTMVERLVHGDKNQ